MKNTLARESRWGRDPFGPRGKYHTDKKRHFRSIAATSAGADRSSYFRFFCPIINNISVLSSADEYMETIPTTSLLR